jgi:hypothetical protein
LPCAPSQHALQCGPQPGDGSRSGGDVGKQAAKDMSPEEQSKAFFDSLKGDAASDNDGDDDGVVKGKGKKTKKTAMKKQAAKAKAKAKEKEEITKAAKAKAKCKATASTSTCKKPVPGWTNAQRLKQYPSGCPKCAWKTAGCTPSCFKQRGQL